jgi:Domain of unknown function (DUF4270)
MQTGCRENTLLSTKISPANDTAGLGTLTLSCITHTYLDDTVLTSTNIGGIPIYEGVGNLYDPYFGITHAATYFQIVPLTYGITFQGNVFGISSSFVFDSAVLVLPYSQFCYGDTANAMLAQQYQVFYLANKMSIDSNYYSFDSVGVSVPLSAPVTRTLGQIRDSFSWANVNYHPHLRIRLNDSMILNMLNTIDSNNSASSFLNVFNGLCVKAVGPSTSFLPYFNLSDGADYYSQAGILVYYTNQTAGYNTDTNILQLAFTPSYCAHLNNVNRSYSGFPVNSLYQSKMANDQIVALQNQPGAGIDVVIQGIKKLPKNIIINQAQLRLSVLPGYNTDTTWGPYTLYPLGIDSVGLAYTVADRYPLTSTSPLYILDGAPHTFTTAAGASINTYTIGMPREITNAYLQGKDTVHLHINGTQDFYGAFHLVAGGGNYPDTNYRAKMIVTYSLLNKH